MTRSRTSSVNHQVMSSRGRGARAGVIAGWLVAALFVLPKSALGYANFIAAGYKSCATCHFDPNGNGPLTDYGRALWATHIADRPPWARDASDEELGEQSNFLFRTPFPKYFRGSLDYRGLVMARDVTRKAAWRYVTMRADATVVLRTDEDNTLFAVGNLGYIEDKRASSTGAAGQAKNMISRAHYVGYHPNKNWTFQAGFTDFIYGLRIPDHVAYSRQKTELAENDQTHGVVATYQQKKWEASFQAFAGNLYQDAGVRPKGASGRFEMEIAENRTFGASWLYSTSDFRSRVLGGLFSRVKLFEESSLIAEIGVIHNSPKNGDPALQGSYLFAQYFGPLRRGLYFLPTAEFYTERTFVPAPRYFRLGPGIQWFPFQRVELRADLQGQYQVAPSGNTFQINWFAQLHVSL